MVSDLLAKEVDFFSIGTNDLTQYTLAIDRQNPKLDNIYDSHHPAILRMIQMVIDNGHKENCWVYMCQISLLYSSIVRSDEKKPALLILIKVLRAQSILLQA